MKRNHLAIALSIPAVAAGVTPAAALAHHPLAGAPMETFAHGLLSGIGHPVIGFDHLFFVVAVGLAAAFVARPLSAPAAYVAAMLAGTLLASIGMGLPAVETMVVLSLVCLGAVLAWGRKVHLAAMLCLFAGFGLFHGAAFGEAVATREAAVGPGVLLGYLLGLAVVQYAICVAAARVSEALPARDSSGVTPSMIAGGGVAGVGAFLAMETIGGAAFAALGIA